MIHMDTSQQPGTPQSDPDQNSGRASAILSPKLPSSASVAGQFAKDLAVLSGIDRVLVVAFLLPYAMLALCVVFVIRHPEYGFWPVAFGAINIAALVWLYRVSGRVAARAPERYKITFNRRLKAAQIICPIGAIALGVLLYLLDAGVL